ncbi:hypothetical protein LTR66_005767 [Elasticomyces elasticus]|nr:hypothetical protein LTR66_005767 [Elasticomyces elasticus]KAK5010709.1 hypothetical protein LTR28_008258 [Elasticomyces elasticus]
MFARYLDIQKQLDIDNLAEDEVKGRWKSFVSKWNRGELAEGWYDPATKQRAEESASTWRSEARSPTHQQKDPLDHGEQTLRSPLDTGNSGDEDDYGPTLPAQAIAHRRPGPSIPSLEDLEYKKELSLEDEHARRADIRYARKVDRQVQKERLEEIAPRAQPGTRERQLEKKREVAAANRSFREARSPGAAEVGESELLGDDTGGFKAQKLVMERKKNERELRKEEVLRARMAERGERITEHRAKEEKTMEVLKALAKQRFG